MGYVWALLIVVLVCVLGWIVGEAKNLRALRVPCVLVMLLLACIMPYGIGKFSGAANASIQVTGATHTFIFMAVEQLDAGNADRVHDELRFIAERINQTYEGGAYAEHMRQATERLGTP